MFYSSHNWKDENTNIYNYKTSNRFLYSSVFSDIFCWRQFLWFRTITSSVKFRSILPIWEFFLIHRTFLKKKKKSLGWEGLKCSSKVPGAKRTRLLPSYYLGLMEVCCFHYLYVVHYLTSVHTSQSCIHFNLWHLQAIVFSFLNSLEKLRQYSISAI